MQLNAQSCLTLDPQANRNLSSFLSPIRYTSLVRYTIPTALSSTLALATTFKRRVSFPPNDCIHPHRLPLAVLPRRDQTLQQQSRLSQRKSREARRDDRQEEGEHGDVGTANAEKTTGRDTDREIIDAVLQRAKMRLLSVFSYLWGLPASMLVQCPWSSGTQSERNGR